MPNGYVLKRDKKKLEDKGEEISLVDLIESERNALGSHTVSFYSNTSNFQIWLVFVAYLQTKVTLESFLSWKKRKIQEKKDKMAKEEEQKMKNYKSGKQFGLSGKEMFSFNPDLADDGPMEEGDAVFDSYARSDDDDDDAAFEYKEVDLDDLAFAAQEVRKSYDFNCSGILYICYAIIRWTVLEQLPLKIVYMDLQHLANRQPHLVPSKMAPSHRIKMESLMQHRSMRTFSWTRIWTGWMTS